MVSIVCCFIHREVRIECLLFACELLKKIRCLESLSCMKCLDSDYIRQLRYAYNENRAGSLSARVPLNVAPRPDNPLDIKIYKDTVESNIKSKKKSSLKSFLNCNRDKRESTDLTHEIDGNPALMATLQPPRSSKIRTYSNNESINDVNMNMMNDAKRRSSATMSLISSGPTRVQQFFSCLFGNKRNDFHQQNGARKMLRSTSSADDKKTARGSAKPSISEEPNENFGARNPLIKLFKLDENTRSESLTSTNKKKVRLLLSVDKQNDQSSQVRMGSHQELGSNEFMDQGGLSDEEELENKMVRRNQKRDIRASKSQTNSELSSVDGQLNNTTTESTNCTETNFTNSSNNSQNGPITCSRCQKRRVSSISNNFYHSDGQAPSFSAEEDSPSKYCKCRLDQLMNETSAKESSQYASSSTKSPNQSDRNTVNDKEKQAQEKQPLLSSQHSSLESDSASIR